MADTTSLFIFVLLSLGCHGPLSPFLPATFEPILLLYGQHHAPIIVAFVAALTSIGAEYINYYIYRRVLSCESLGRLMRSDSARPLTVLFARHPFLAVWVTAWSPLPDWAARVLACHSRYSVRRYLSALLLGRLPKFWLIAQAGFYWMPDKWTVASIVAASTMVTIVGARRGARRDRAQGQAVAASR
jgi:uncharacterized membrane protein YdjX (TVP38/TMEM64 family)